MRELNSALRHGRTEAHDLIQKHAMMDFSHDLYICTDLPNTMSSCDTRALWARSCPELPELYAPVLMFDDRVAKMLRVWGLQNGNFRPKMYVCTWSELVEIITGMYLKSDFL